MRTVALATLASLAVTLVFSSPVQAEIRWEKNLRTAHAKAEAEGKLMLLHFYSDNCVYCDRLEAGAFQSDQVGEAIAQNFIPIKIHANSAPELVKAFKVTKFPTDVVVTTDAKKIVHRVSPQDSNKYVAMLAGSLPAMPNKNQAIAASTTPATPPAPETIVPPASVASASPETQPDSQLAGFRDQGFEMPADVEHPGMTLEPEITAPVTSTATASPPATGSSPVASISAAQTSDQPELAMEGFCAVTVISEDRWVEGKPEHGVIHLGKLYLFSNEEAMNLFLADPIPYTPVLNEIDVVRFFEERIIVPGKREWGVKDPDFQRMFFFADEAAMNHFMEEYDRYTEAAIEVMQKAVKDANPQS